MFRDERGKVSCGRVLLVGFTAHCMALVWLRLTQLSPAVLTFHAGIETALITWNAGARIAQYISPLGQSLVNALPKAPWRVERDVATGIDPTKD